MGNSDETGEKACLARPAWGAGGLLSLLPGGLAGSGLCTGTLRPHQAPCWRQGRRRSWQGHEEAGAGSRRWVYFQASDKAGFSCFSASPGSRTAAWASSCCRRTSASPGPQRALFSQNQTPTTSCIACGEGTRPSATMQRALYLFHPPAAFLPPPPAPCLGARVVTLAVPRSPAPAAWLPRGPKC